MTRHRSPLAMMCAASILLAACGSDDAADPAVPPAEPPSTESPTTTMETPASEQPSGEYPITIETCGTEVTFERAPSSVVVGWPTIITTLDALGVGGTVVGYTSADLATAPPTRAEAIAPDFRTSREVMIASGLDMFIVNDENQVDASAGNLGWSDLDGLDAGGYVLGGYCLDAPAATEVDVIYDDISTLGAIFGVTEEAAALNDRLRQRIETAASAIRDLAGTNAAVVQVFDGTLYALSGTYYAMIPGELGLASVFGDLDANFAEISAEEVLTLAPDVIVVVHEGDADEAAAAVDEVRDLLASAPAVTDDRIATVQNGVLSGGGVSVVDVIVDVADQLAS